MSEFQYPRTFVLYARQGVLIREGMPMRDYTRMAGFGRSYPPPFLPGKSRSHSRKIMRERLGEIR